MLAAWLLIFIHQGRRPENQIVFWRRNISAGISQLASGSESIDELGGGLELAIQVPCQQMGVFGTSNKQILLSDSEAVPFSKVQVVENSERTMDMERFVQPMNGMLVPSSNAPLKDIQAELEKAVAPEIQLRVVERKRAGKGWSSACVKLDFMKTDRRPYALRRVTRWIVWRRFWRSGWRVYESKATPTTFQFTTHDSLRIGTVNFTRVRIDSSVRRVVPHGPGAAFGGRVRRIPPGGQE